MVGRRSSKDVSLLEHHGVSIHRYIHRAIEKKSDRQYGGPSLQAGYTWGKSRDDVSGILGGTGSTGAVTLFSPQDPFDTQAERGPSSFDVTQAFTLSAAQDLHFEHLGLQSDRTHLLTKGWELLSISTITSGSPFTVYSGIQQTGAGTNRGGPAGSDRNAGSFDRWQFNAPARRLFWTWCEQRKFLFSSHRHSGWNRTKLRALWNARP